MSIAAVPAVLPTIRVNEVGEFVRNRSCERRFKLEFDGRAEARLLPFFERLFNPLDPVLQDMGQAREDEWEQMLVNAGIPAVDITPTGADGEATWPDFLAAISGLQPGQRCFGREISVSADLGAFHVQGRMDFVVLDWQGEQPLLRIIECKASRRDRTYHRIQVALYRMMVRQLLAQAPALVGAHPLVVDGIGCSVARIDETTNQVQPIDGLCGLDLAMEEADLTRLLSPDGDLIRIANSDLADLDYQLDSKCDNCVFNVHCLAESARLRRLELLSLAPSSIRILNAANVATLDDLADLDLTSAPAQQVSHNFNFGESQRLIEPFLIRVSSQFVAITVDLFRRLKSVIKIIRCPQRARFLNAASQGVVPEGCCSAVGAWHYHLCQAVLKIPGEGAALGVREGRIVEGAGISTLRDLPR
jgi:hypothetical protein